MDTTRRDFLKYTGATALVIASSDLVASCSRNHPRENPLTVHVQGLADVAVGRGEAAWLHVADIASRAA